MDDSQAIQEDEYRFPYHYLPESKNGEFQWSPYWSWGYRYLSALELVFERLQAANLKSIVDVGCGDGRLLRELAQRRPDVATLGIDYSERAISLAKALNPGIEFAASDIVTQAPGRRFDAVTLIEVLEHISPERVADFVAALRRLMHPASILIVTVPHKNQALIEKHFQHFDADGLRRVFEPHFRVESMFFFDANSSAVKIMQRLVFNRYFILRHSGALRFLYGEYCKRYLRCSERNCLRLGAVLRVGDGMQG
jgi:cyclopropane fatty-acyl-phospholipid synthase-like methyltransferase